METRAEARQCADLFRANRDQIDGIIVTLPNFGDERGIAEALRMADLRVPMLIQATPDTPGHMTIADRRDSFCGKMCVCNNLQQYRHPVLTDDAAYRGAGVGRIHGGPRRGSPPYAAWRTACGKLRIGAIGARPAAFNTVRYSEKLLESTASRSSPSTCRKSSAASTA